MSTNPPPVPVTVTLIYVYPDVKLQDLPRCESVVGPDTSSYRHFRRARGDTSNAVADDQCNRKAKYDVDGKKLCRRHAEAYVLDETVRRAKESK